MLEPDRISDLFTFHPPKLRLVLDPPLLTHRHKAGSPHDKPSFGRSFIRLSDSCCIPDHRPNCTRCQRPRDKGSTTSHVYCKAPLIPRSCATCSNPRSICTNGLYLLSRRRIALSGLKSTCEYCSTNTPSWVAKCGKQGIVRVDVGLRTSPPCNSDHVSPCWRARHSWILRVQTVQDGQAYLKIIG